jgi:RHS repeat-associated protein
MTDQAASLVWDKVPRPFGETFSVSGAASGPGGNPKRFPGQLHDPETGFNYNDFRDYDPTTGRYLQSDPIGLDGGLNTYAYVGGNPIQKIDPKGLNPAVGAAIGTIVGGPVGGLVGGLLGAGAGLLLGDWLFNESSLLEELLADDVSDDYKDHCVRLYERCQDEVWGGRLELRAVSILLHGYAARMAIRTLFAGLELREVD